MENKDILLKDIHMPHSHKSVFDVLAKIGVVLGNRWEEEYESVETEVESLIQSILSHPQSKEYARYCEAIDDFDLENKEITNGTR